MAEIMTKEKTQALNPGSYNEFITEHNIPDTQEAIVRHSEATLGYRLALAAQRGLSLEELHTGSIDYHQPAAS